MPDKRRCALQPFVLIILFAGVTSVLSYGLMELGPHLAPFQQIIDDNKLKTGKQKRIISLSPAITETIVALNAIDSLVGMSDYCVTPKSFTLLPKLGTALTPNFEAIANLQPDLILTEATKHGHQSGLNTIAPTIHLPWLTKDEVTSSIQRLGEITQSEKIAEKITDHLEQHLTQQPPQRGPEVLLLSGLNTFNGAPMWYMKRNSLHGSAIHAAGARNAINRDITGAPSISIEELLRINPEIIVTIIPQENFEQRKQSTYLQELKKLKTLKAVKNGKLSIMSGKSLLSTGPSIVTFSAALREELNSL
ncbi:MAG: ABC transporter substrate-binding protein [Myxococcota bacterium]|nr:ABC transporter substrate-binding protein [Myxococcota bacterium]